MVSVDLSDGALPRIVTDLASTTTAVLVGLGSTPSCRESPGIWGRRCEASVCACGGLSRGDVYQRYYNVWYA
jgi:hypothetical protein